MMTLRLPARALLAAALLGTAAAALAQTAPVLDDGMRAAIRDEVRRAVGEEVRRALAEQSASRTAPASAAAASTTVDVNYVPEAVRNQIRDEIKTELVTQAKTEQWGKAADEPEWTRRITIFGDVRFRNEARFFDRSNRIDLLDFNGINNGGGYDVSAGNPALPSIQNTLADRNFLRVRARFGVDARVNDMFGATIRLATGSDASPVSTDQTLGGFFSKKSVWVDQAFIDFHPVDGLHIQFGRDQNLFVTTPLVWDTDVNPDGVMVSYVRPVTERLTLAARAGAFSLDYAPDGFPNQTTGDQKVSSTQNRYIFAGQLGASYDFTSQFSAGLDGAYYDYHNVRGLPSPACLNTAPFCATDYSRPTFVQKGNTLFQLRNFVIPNPAATSQVQYFGYASKFAVGDVIAHADYLIQPGLRIRATADVAKNFAFNRAAILQQGLLVTNTDVCTVAVPAGGTCPLPSQALNTGDMAYLARLEIGRPKLVKFGDWTAFAEYRHIDPDAVLDALTDSDFHLGGTNAKGYVVGGAMSVGRGVSLGARWLSADSIYGSRLAIDVLQVDLSAAF